MKANKATINGVVIEISDDGEVTIEGAKRVDIRHVFETTGRGSFFRRTLDDHEDPEHQMVIIRTDLKDIQKIGVEVCGMNEPWSMVERPRMDVQIGYMLSPNDTRENEIRVMATRARTRDAKPSSMLLGTMGLDQYVDRGRRDAADRKRRKAEAKEE